MNHNGPNNQLKDFVKCAIIALVNKYTLILPPLFPHHGDKMGGIQWFDHFYDLKQLRLVINFISLDQFIEAVKKPTIDVTIDCYLQQIELVQTKTWYSKNALEAVEAYYHIKIHFRRYMNLSSSLKMRELSKKMRDCPSIFLHNSFVTFNEFFQSSNHYVELIFSHFNRSALIQRMATKIIQLLPQLLIGTTSKTNLTTLAVAHLRQGDRSVMSVSKYTQQVSRLIKSGVGFTHIYIMCPYLNSSDIAQMTRDLSIPFTTTGQLLNHGHFVMDEYLFDVLEQEIAFQAPVFIATPLSTYSGTVTMQKVYQNKGAVYLFSTKGENRPSVVTRRNARYSK